jgi:two-component system, sensor histidine kinase PdtaS
LRISLQQIRSPMVQLSTLRRAGSGRYGRTAWPCCQDSPEIKLSIEADTLHCDIDMAMPLGLITNELMTNAVKHGFKDHQRGEITVTLKRRDDAVVLSVSDTGVGCLDSGECVTETTTQSHGIGTTLIKELVRQIEGEFILMQDITGTTARVRIPLHGFR